MVHRFIIITLLCLVLNFPENLLRLAGAIGFEFMQPEHMPLAIVVLSQAMYFLQVNMNFNLDLKTITTFGLIKILPNISVQFMV